MIALVLAGGAIAIPFLLVTELDPRIGIPAAVIVGAIAVYYVVLLISYQRRGGS